MRMRLILLSLISSATTTTTTTAFQVVRPTLRSLSSRALPVAPVEEFVSSVFEAATAGIKAQAAKQHLIETCRRLKGDYGLFLIDKTAKQEFQEAVAALENLSEPPEWTTNAQDTLVGDWTLLGTTSTSQEGIDTSRIPFFKDGPLQELRQSLRKAVNRYWTVQQRIKPGLDRIDHVLEYAPPAHLNDVIANIPEQLSNLNINPLDVSKTELVLVHKATLESEAPLKTKLALTQIVLNVAGTSTLLDPAGKDLVGFTVPWGEFLNTGTFETTYMDNNLRISRGKQGPIDQLRVFVRAGSVVDEPLLEDIAAMETSGRLDQTVNSKDEGQDVDEIASRKNSNNNNNGQDDVSPSDY